MVTVDDPSPTISVIWDRAVQVAVIESEVGPTIASRVYALVHTVMFDAWAAYDPVAIATQFGDHLQRPAAENTDANKTAAMSFAGGVLISRALTNERLLLLQGVTAGQITAADFA